MERNTEKIYEIMRQKGLTQQALAGIMNVHRQAVNYWLTNKTNGITLKTVGRLADALQVNAKDLIT